MLYHLHNLQAVWQIKKVQTFLKSIQDNKKCPKKIGTILVCQEAENQRDFRQKSKEKTTKEITRRDGDTETPAHNILIIFILLEFILKGAVPQKRRKGRYGKKTNYHSQLKLVGLASQLRNKKSKVAGRFWLLTKLATQYAGLHSMVPNGQLNIMRFLKIHQRSTCRAVRCLGRTYQQILLR